MSETKIDKQIVALKQQKAAIRKNRMWKCSKCKKSTRISKLELLIEEYYVEPYSCSGGDYWTEGDHPSMYIRCPKCKVMLRHYNERSNDYKFVEEYRYDFGSRKTVYNKRLELGERHPWINY